MKLKSIIFTSEQIERFFQIGHYEVTIHYAKQYADWTEQAKGLIEEKQAKFWNSVRKQMRDYHYWAVLGKIENAYGDPISLSDRGLEVELAKAVENEIFRLESFFETDPYYKNFYDWALEQQQKIINRG